MFIDPTVIIHRIFIVIVVSKGGAYFEMGTKGIKHLKSCPINSLVSEQWGIDNKTFGPDKKCPML